LETSPPDWTFSDPAPETPITRESLIVQEEVAPMMVAVPFELAFSPISVDLFCKVPSVSVMVRVPVVLTPMTAAVLGFQSDIVGGVLSPDNAIAAEDIKVAQKKTNAAPSSRPVARMLGLERRVAWEIPRDNSESDDFMMYPLGKWW
jgi:hypothetical protein